MSTVPLWFAIPLLLAAVLGLVINTCVVLLAIANEQGPSADNLLVLHLALTNLALGVSFIFFSAPGLLSETWMAAGPLCYTHGFLFMILHPLVLWTVCGLNADRYYAIAAPLHYGHLVNPKRVYLCLGIGWIVSLAFTVFPFAQIAPFTFNPGLGACVPNFQSGRTTLWYSAAYTAFTLLLPITLIICFNVKILMIARYHRHRIASAIYEVTLSAQVTITHQRNPFFVPTVTAPSAGGPKFRSCSPVSTVLQLLGSVVLLYVPYYTIILWESCITFLDSDAAIDDHIGYYHVVLVLLTLAPIVNGILYGVMDKNLRKTFQNYWRKKISKSKVNQEIQARTPSTCGSRRQSLTHFGFFGRHNIHRRQSETLIVVRRDESTENRLKANRNSSEIAWRPQGPNEFPLISARTSRLQVPKANISECSLDIDSESLQLDGGEGSTSDNFIIEHPQSREHLTLAIEDSRQAIDQPTTKRKTSFLYKFFGVEGNKTPKILITRAHSEEDYTKAARESSKHSLSASSPISKWYHHSEFNLLSEQAKQDPSAMTKLLWDSRDPAGESNSLDDDSDSVNSYGCGMYMHLDSYDTLRTQSCDMDMQDIEQMESIEDEFKNISYDEDLELQQKLADCPIASSSSMDDTIPMRIANGEQKGSNTASLVGRSSSCVELVKIKNHEVVL